MKFILVVVFGFVILFRATAQDFPMSQAYSNPFWMCPALAGNSDAPRISSFYRSQWPDISGSYKTAMFGFDSGVKKVHGGLGLYGIYDNSADGTLIEWSLNGIYSYHGKINDNLTLRSGAQFTYGRKILDWSQLIFPDQIDPRHGFVFDTSEPLPEGGLKKSYFDLGLSVAADWKKFTFGVSGFHLTSPDVGFISESHLDRRYVTFAGYDLWFMKGEKPEGFHVSPLVYYTTSTFGYSMLTGTNVSWNWLYAGSYYRFGENNPDAVIFQAGARFWHFQAGYSYDMTVSKLTNASGGSHEVFLNYLFANRKDK